EGQIHNVLVKEGDAVKAGQVLMEMDTTDLLNHKASAQAEAAAKENARIKAEGEKDYSSAGIAEKERDKALLEVAYYDDKIKEGTIKAAIDGRVLLGDWEHKKFTMVKQGDPLFHIGDINKLSGELAVADRDMQLVEL